MSEGEITELPAHDTFYVGHLGPRRTFSRRASAACHTMPKAQVGNPSEMSLVPYIPVPGLVARKFAALRSAGISGVMASWTLGT
jgi:hypothetical protein